MLSKPCVELYYHALSYCDMCSCLPFSTEYNLRVPGPQGAGAAPTLQWYHVYPVPRSLRSLDISWEVGTGSLGSSALPITALYRGRGQQQYLCRCLWITMFTN